MSLPFRSSIAVLATIALLAGCKKDFDSPPKRDLPVGSVLTLAQLRALFNGTPLHFSDTAGAVNTVYAVVTADEQDGNLYKNIYVQDHTAGIVLRLMNSGGLYRGDSIRIYLPGCVLSSYQSMLQIDSVNVDNNVVKQATGVVIQPRLVTIAQVTPDLQGQLIKLDNIQFAASDTGLTFADAVGQTTVNRNLEDCGTGTIIARNSGYSNYAAVHVPTGKGSMVATVGQFGSTMQLNIRSLAEVQMNGARCGQAACTAEASVTQDFANVVNNANITADQAECWSNVQTAGSRTWRGRTDASSNMCAEAAVISFDASNIEWLITRPLIFHSGMTLTFQSAWAGTAWVHDGLTLWVSTDFTTDASTATWTQVTGATIAGSVDANGAWVNSGAVTLDSALPVGYTGNFVVAFKYTGSSAQNTAYRVDNVSVN